TRTICPKISSSISSDAASENVSPPTMIRPCSIVSITSSHALARRKSKRRARIRRLKTNELMSDKGGIVCPQERGRGRGDTRFYSSAAGLLASDTTDFRKRRCGDLRRAELL